MNGCLDAVNSMALSPNIELLNIIIHSLLRDAHQGKKCHLAIPIGHGHTFWTWELRLSAVNATHTCSEGLVCPSSAGA